MSNKLLIIAGVIGVLVLAVALPAMFVMGSYNRLVKANESINGSWAQVENVLQRRYDLIPNLVNTVKGYAKHEQGILEEVTRLRSQWGEAKSPQARMQASQGLEGVLGRLMVVVENYPNLKANENFLKLQDELAGTENRIAVERMRYNELVKEYNVMVKSFPSNVIGRLFGFGKRDAYFQAAEPAKAAPKVEF